MGKVDPARVAPRKGKRSTASTAGRNAPKTARPPLLPGGNPQIAKADGDAPVQTYIAAMPGWKRDLGRRLDALITSTVPGVRKAVRWNSPFYGGEARFARWINVREGDLDEAQLTTWIKQAAAPPGWNGS